MKVGHDADRDRLAEPLADRATQRLSDEERRELWLLLAECRFLERLNGATAR